MAKFLHLSYNKCWHELLHTLMRQNVNISLLSSIRNLAGLGLVVGFIYDLENETETYLSARVSTSPYALMMYRQIEPWSFCLCSYSRNGDGEMDFEEFQDMLRASSSQDDTALAPSSRRSFRLKTAP